MVNQRNPLLQVRRKGGHTSTPLSLSRTHPSFGPNARNHAQLLYLVLFLGCFAAYLWYGWARIPDLDLLLSQALVGACLYSFKLACGVSPGRISPGKLSFVGVFIADAQIHGRPASLSRALCGWGGLTVGHSRVTLAFLT